MYPCSWFILYIVFYTSYSLPLSCPSSCSYYGNCLVCSLPIWSFHHLLLTLDIKQHTLYFQQLMYAYPAGTVIAKPGLVFHSCLLNPQWLSICSKFKLCWNLVQHTQPVSSLSNLPFPWKHPLYLGSGTVLLLLNELSHFFNFVSPYVNASMLDFSCSMLLANSRSFF